MSSVIPATSTLTLAGIDVSHHQGEVNWHAVAEAGISFAFAKATEGATFVDPQFSRNWAPMKDAGIVRGAYHFFRPAKPAESQVANFLKAVNELGDGDLPAVLDLEEAPTPHGDEWEEVPAQNRVPLVLTWLDAVANSLGRKPIIYTRRGFIELELPEPAILAQFPLGSRTTRPGLRRNCPRSGGLFGSTPREAKLMELKAMWTLTGSMVRRQSYPDWRELRFS